MCGNLGEAHGSERAPGHALGEMHRLLVSWTSEAVGSPCSAGLAFRPAALQYPFTPTQDSGNALVSPRTKGLEMPQLQRTGVALPKTPRKPASRPIGMCYKAVSAAAAGSRIF